CTNCQQNHVKCTGAASCKRCTRFNLMCTFNDSGKKQGPKKNDKLPEKVYVPNYLRNDFDRTPMLFSVISNAVQGYTSTLSLQSGYPQQSYDIDGFTLYSDSYEEQNVLAFQEAMAPSFIKHIPILDTLC
ncbi:1372_t:CDS:1, partial [Gigaspora margarita]